MASTSLSARQGYAPARVAARAGAKPVSAARAPLRVVAGESRIGKHPVPVPKGVTYTLKDNHLAVKVGAGHLLRSDSYSAARCDAVARSRRRPRPTPVASVRAATDRVLGFWLTPFSDPLGSLRPLVSQGPKGELEFQFPDLMIMTEEDGAIRLSKADETKKAKEGHGLYRTLCNNMMVGVSEGFEKKLKLVGVGYKAAMQGKDLNLSLGYAHQVILEVPQGLKVECTSNTEITVSGYDKVEVGNFAAIIRSKRKPEPYKGKGVRYADEVVLIKEGKRK